MTNPRLRFVIGTVFACGLASNATPAAETGASDIPPNIIVDAVLEPIVVRMISLSASFRALCRDLAKLPSLRVHVMLALPSESARGRCRAEGLMQKHEFGGISAWVRIPSQRHAVELIAHELEHVREYAEGLNYRLMAASSPRVWRTRSGHYETVRAEEMGRRVAEEVRPKNASN